MSKWSWRRLVKDYVRNKCRNELLEAMKTYKKLEYEQCSKEELKRKKYFFDLNLERIRFKALSNMLETFKANFPSKYRNESLACKECKETNIVKETEINEPKDTQSHNLTTCVAYSQLRQQFDLNTDIGIVNYFKAVIKKRIYEDIL